MPAAAPASPLPVAPPPAPTEELSQFEIVLPPKVVTQPKIDPATGMPSTTGEEETIQVPRALGVGGEIVLQWSAYFPPTPQDQAQITQSLTTATGAKAFLSQETATECAAKAFGVDPAEEWRRVRDEGAAATASQAAMMDTGAAGGAVSSPHEQPPGAEPAPDEHPAAGIPPIPSLPVHPVNDPDADIPIDVDLTGM